MGWAPWNEFEIHTSGDIFIQQMDLMKEYGLIDVRVYLLYHRRNMAEWS